MMRVLVCLLIGLLCLPVSEAMAQNFGNINPGYFIGNPTTSGTLGITETCGVTPTSLTIKGGIITARTGGTCIP